MHRSEEGLRSRAHRALLGGGGHEHGGQILDQFKTHEVERALLTLPARDAKILRLYFGLEEDREHTLDEIGKMLGVTRERVRQLRDRALKRLRHGAVGDVLRDLTAA